MMIGFDRRYCTKIDRGLLCGWGWVYEIVNFQQLWLVNPPLQDAREWYKQISVRSYFTNQPTQKIMTKTEILAALKNLTAEERLEIIEAASRMMREEIEEKAQRKAERKQKLRAAAAAAVKDYMPGGALYDLWSSDSASYFDSEEESLNAGVQTNA
jgi:hypothetical protein